MSENSYFHTMNTNLKIYLIAIPFMVLAACGDDESGPVQLPVPVFEVFSYELGFKGLECDRSGVPYVLVREIREIGQPDQGNLEIVSHIYRFADDSLTPVYTDLPQIEEFSPAQNNTFYGISSDRRALIGIGQGGLDTLYLSPYVDKPFIGHGTITNVLTDLHGNIWITLYGEGLARINGFETAWYNTENTEILSDYIISIAVDQSNTLWLGHQGEGISRILDNGSIDVITDFTSQNIYSLTTDRSHNMLLGLGRENNDTLVYRIGSGGFTDLSPELNISFPDTMVVIPDIAVDLYNRIWINVVYTVDFEDTGMDLFYFDNEWKQMYLRPDDKDIIALRSDTRDGIIYVLTTKSLYRIK